jgi:hypothetical protein
MRNATALALLLALALPAAAAARPVTVAPPGLPEAEQYFETLPTSTGPRAPDTTRKAHYAVLAGALSPAGERSLRRRGPRGLALADAVAQTAPRGGSGEDSEPALGSLGDGGLGAAFPLLLALAAAVAAGFAVTRRRPVR